MKRPEMEVSAEMPIESKEVEKKRKDELDWKDREGRDPREGKEKRPTTVTIPRDQATRRSEEGALDREKPRESARQGGGSRAPTMRNRSREVRSKFGGRNETRKTMGREDGICEA